MATLRVDTLEPVSNNPDQKSIDVKDLLGLKSNEVLNVFSDFSEIVNLEPVHGEVIEIMGRWPNREGEDLHHVDPGQGLFWWDERATRRDHDGGVYLSPTVDPILPDRSNDDDYNEGVGESNPDAVGCWRRIIPQGSPICSDWWGRTAGSLQKALDFDEGSSSKVYFSNISYTLEQPLVIRSNTSLEMHPATELYCPEGVGPAIMTEIVQDSPVSLTSSANTGDVVLTVEDVSGISGGDWILLASEFAPRDNVNKMGEYVQVSSTNTSANSIILRSSVQFDHLTSDSAFIQRTDFYKNISISGGDIRGTRSNATQSQGVAVDLAFVENACVKDLVARDFHYGGVRFRGVQGGSMENCEFFDIWANDSETSSTPFLYKLGYSTDTQEGCRNIVIQNIRGTRVGKLWDATGSSSRYGFSSDIVCRDLFGKNIRRQAFGSHVAVTRVLIENVYSDAPYTQENRGLHWRGGHLTLRNINIEGAAAGFWMQPENPREETRFTIRDSSFVSSQSGNYGGIVVEPRERVSMGVVNIANCYVNVDDAQAVQISMNVTGREISNYIDRIKISDCTLYNNAGGTDMTESDGVGCLDLYSRNDSRLRTVAITGNQVRNESSTGAALSIRCHADGTIGRVQVGDNYLRAGGSCVRAYAGSSSQIDKIACNGGDYEAANTKFEVDGAGTVYLGYHYMNYSDGWQQDTIFNNVS